MLDCFNFQFSLRLPARALSCWLSLLPSFLPGPTPHPTPALLPGRPRPRSSLPAAGGGRTWARRQRPPPSAPAPRLRAFWPGHIFPEESLASPQAGFGSGGLCAPAHRFAEASRVAEPGLGRRRVSPPCQAREQRASRRHLYHHASHAEGSAPAARKQDSLPVVTQL